jgi:hypothetical protein
VALLEAEPVLDYLLPYDPEAVGGQLPGVRCTEDRPRADTYPLPLLPEANDMTGELVEVKVPDRPDDNEALTAQGMLANAQRTGLSVTGGLSGIVVAQTVALGMDGISADKLPQIQVVTSTLNHLNSSLGEDHDHCLGRTAARSVLEFAVNNPNATQQATGQIAPWLDQGQFFGDFQDSVRQILARDALFPAQTDPDATPLRPLRGIEGEADTPPAHAATRIVAIGNAAGPHVLWDTTAAWDAGHPGYALNTGLLFSLARVVERTIGGNPENMTAAMLFFQGAATHLLPRPKGDDVPLNIQYVQDWPGKS